MIPLAIGTLLAIGALAFVLYPLFAGGAAAPPPRRSAPAAPSARQLAVEALREIEFDRATGKLSEADYDEMKARYTQQAVAAMRAEGSAPPSLTDDAVEAEIRRFRALTPAGAPPACRTCGPRPEPDAAYCSTCGSYLAGACAHCGAPVEAPGARFCPSCGHRLAA